MTKNINKFAFQNAFTLLEIMVAMVIFAVGMLGLAGIQGLSLENSHSSYSRSQAILTAYEIVDRMKANSTAGATYVITPATVTAEPGTLCDAVACNNVQMATFDLWQWKASLPALLPTGSGRIVNTGGTNYRVTVYWDEDRTGATATNNCPPTVATDLRCFELITEL